MKQVEETSDSLFFFKKWTPFSDINEAIRCDSTVLWNRAKIKTNDMEGTYQQPKLGPLRQLPQLAHLCASRGDRRVVGWR